MHLHNLPKDTSADRRKTRSCAGRGVIFLGVIRSCYIRGHCDCTFDRALGVCRAFALKLTPWPR